MYISGTDIYLISANSLKQRSVINANVEDRYILSALKSAQDIRLVGVIGKPLVTKLCTLVAQNAMGGKYKELTDEYLFDYLTYQTLAEIQVPLWTKIRQQGLVRQNATEQDPITKNDIAYTREYYESLAIALQKPMFQFLDENVSSIPEWADMKSKRHTKYQTHFVL